MSAVSTVLSRRNVGCISDLTIDRWLLGEAPHADDARRIETHVRGCVHCAARVGALRGLYSTQPDEPRHEPPVHLANPPVEEPGQSGALQLVILRDGLLVGSEYFMPGSYTIGSDARADLRLDGVAPAHGRLFFRAGRVAVQSGQGPCFVNGFKVDSAEVRPIDEVVIGPYVLRSRVIRERWSDPVTDVLPAKALADATVVEPPTKSPRVAEVATRVTLELWWGASRQDARSFDTSVTAREFPLWGFDVDDDFVIAQRGEAGRFVVSVPRGAKVSQPSLCLAAGQRICLSRGTMRLVVTVEPVLRSHRVPLPLHGPTFALSAVLLTAVILGGAMAPVPEEQPFDEVHAARIIHPVVHSRVVPPVAPSVSEIGRAHV
jgi:hypothetical protein